jgi:hypothetical protein
MSGGKDGINGDLTQDRIPLCTEMLPADWYGEDEDGFVLRFGLGLLVTAMSVVTLIAILRKQKDARE